MTSVRSHEVTTTANTSTVTLASWMEIHDELCRGGIRRHQLLVNHCTGLALRLNEPEVALCRRLQEGVASEAELDADERSFVAELRADDALEGPPTNPADQHRPPSNKSSFLSTLDARWTGAHRLVRNIYDRGGRRLFTRLSLTIQIALGGAGFLALVAVVSAHHSLELRVHPAQIPWIIAMSLVALSIHELAHALVVVHLDRRVDAIGMRLFLGTPCVYVESVDALLLTRKQRLIQAAAGPWAEWLVVSMTALVLYALPTSTATPLLYRFVILNAATIASNLLPFAGLDGSWVLADAIHEPDLGQRSRGAVCHLLRNLLCSKRNETDDWGLAVYSILNSLIATLLIATSVFFWYQLFGNITDTLRDHGPIGWLALLITAAVLGRPIINAIGPRLLAGIDTLRVLVNDARFRSQRRWRIAATKAFARDVDELANLTDEQLGIVAGQLGLIRGSSARNVAAEHFVWIRSGHARLVDEGRATKVEAGTTCKGVQRITHWSLTCVLVTFDPSILEYLLCDAATT